MNLDNLDRDSRSDFNENSPTRHRAEARGDASEFSREAARVRVQSTGEKFRIPTVKVPMTKTFRRPGKNTPSFDSPRALVCQGHDRPLRIDSGALGEDAAIADS